MLPLLRSPRRPIRRSAESHHRELAAAPRSGAEPIRRAARVATFNAWTTAILAALSAPFALFSVAGLRGVRRHSPSSPGTNSAAAADCSTTIPPAHRSWAGTSSACLALITVYCLWAIYSNLWGSGSIDAQLRANPELKAAFGSLDGMSELIKPIVLAFYGTRDRAERPLPRRQRPLLFHPPQVRRDVRAARRRRG